MSRQRVFEIAGLLGRCGHDQADTAVKGAPHLRFGYLAGLLQPVEHRWPGPRVGIDPRIHVAWQDAGQVLGQATAGDMGDARNGMGLQRRQHRAHVDAGRGEQEVAYRPAADGRGRPVGGSFENAADQRVAVGMRPGGCQAQDHVPGLNRAAVEQLCPVHDTDAETGQVEIAWCIHAGHLCRLPAQQRTAGLTASFGHACHDGGAGLYVQLACREVVEEEQRLGALHQHVVHAHSHQVDAHRIQAPEVDGQPQFGAYTVGTRNKNGVLVGGSIELEQATEAADAAEHAPTVSRGNQRFDSVYQFIAGVDIDTGVPVSQGCFGGHLHPKGGQAAGMIVQMQRTKTRTAAVAPLVALSLCALVVATGAPARAATVQDLYSAEVQAPGDELPEVFRAALAAVAVRVTGSRAASSPETLAALGDPAVLVLQYRVTEPGSWRVGFDPAAVRSRLDAAGLPVWSEERPATLLWLAADSGRGERDILAAAAQGRAGGVSLPPARERALTAARDSLLTAAEERGLPMLLPLVDTEDLQAVTFAELWGDFSAPVLVASARYRADAVLIGRTQTLDLTARRVRWTLLLAGERWDWQGTLADGPERAADRFAERLASAADSLRELRVEVRNVANLDAYGRVYSYLRGLSSVERCDVETVNADRAVFRLSLRGDPDQLLGVVALRRLLVPVDEPSADTDLQFALIAGP